MRQPAELSQAEILDRIDCIDMDNGDHEYYVKGHVDKAIFVAAMQEYHRNEKFSVDHVRHELWRFVPDGSGDYGMLKFNAQKPGKGVFPVTVIDFAY